MTNYIPPKDLFSRPFNEILGAYTGAYTFDRDPVIPFLFSEAPPGRPLQNLEILEIKEYLLRMNSILNEIKKEGDLEKKL